MTASTKISYLQALTEGLRMEMHRDPAVMCVGAGSWARRSPVTRDLASAFGGERIVETEEQARVASVAAGMAASGRRVVCEARAEHLGPDVLAPLGELDSSIEGCVVVRIPDGGRLNAGRFTALETRLLDTPGVTLIAPSTPADAKGMLVNAIRATGATCVLEPEMLYGAVGDVPEGGVVTPPATARLAVYGSRATVVTYGLGASVAAAAVDAAALEVELIDLRSLRPLDEEAIAASVGRTGKVVVVEPARTTRVGAEVAQVLLTRAFEYLDGPLARVELPASNGDEDDYEQAVARVAAGIDDLIAY
jgi:pyruvate/2-oxoglutarate/acetoin dehydrogenase E1 component